MNNDRIQEILDLMEEARLDYFLISDPQSIAYCTGYYNDPHERMFVFMISKHGNHTLFMNDLFYLDHDLDVNIVWHKDGQDAIQTIVDEMHFPGRIGIDKNWASHFLLDLMKKLPDAKYINASPCVDLVRMKKDLQEQILMIESSKINDAVMEEIIPFIQEGVTEKQLAKKLPESIQETCSIAFSSGRYLEMNTKGVDKGYGMRWLVNYLGYDMDETIGIGDNYNDVEMIKTAKLGCAVACASDDIKELAQYVTQKDYDEGAVKEVIEKFVLGENHE